MASGCSADRKPGWASYFGSPVAALMLTIFASAAAAETVVKHETSDERADHSCMAKLHTDAGANVELFLSNDDGLWKIQALISGRPEVYRTFFDDRGLSDRYAFAAAFKAARVGDQTLNLQKATFFEVLRSGVDDETYGLFEFKELHNVVKVLDAMAKDGFGVDGLIKLDGTSDALASFLSCSYAAIGVREGQRVETDFRAEYRMIFEDAFRLWIVHMTKGEHCLAARFDEIAVDSVISEAADAFYPGLWNWRKRISYRDSLASRVSTAQLAGTAEALKGCLMAGQLAEMSRIPVDLAIKEAVELN